MEKMPQMMVGMTRQKNNADPSKFHAQSMMRYNQLLTQVVEITIPLILILEQDCH